MKPITTTNENDCKENSLVFSIHRNVKMELCAGGAFVRGVQRNRSYQIVWHNLNKKYQEKKEYIQFNGGRLMNGLNAYFEYDILDTIAKCRSERVSCVGR